MDKVVCSRDVKHINMGSLVDEVDNSERIIGDNFKADA